MPHQTFKEYIFLEINNDSMMNMRQTAKEQHRKLIVDDALNNDLDQIDIDMSGAPQGAYSSESGSSNSKSNEVILQKGAIDYK